MLYHMAFFADSKKVGAWEKTRPYFNDFDALTEKEKRKDSSVGTKLLRKLRNKLK